MSMELIEFFSLKHNAKELSEDQNFLGITPLSNIGHITSYSLGLLSFGVGIYTVYSLRKRKIEILTDYRMLGFLVGFILLKLANSIHYYDQKSYINSYHKEITKRICALITTVKEGKLEGFPKEVVENEWRKIFDSLEASHGWSNLIRYKILCNDELHKILFYTLKNYSYHEAEQKYRKICSETKLEVRYTFLTKLWGEMESSKTILDLLEERYLPIDLSETREQWQKALGENQAEYLAYRAVVRSHIKEFKEKKSTALQNLYSQLKYDAGEYKYQVLKGEVLEGYNKELEEAKRVLDAAIKLESDRQLNFDKGVLLVKLKELHEMHPRKLQKVKLF